MNAAKFGLPLGLFLVGFFLASGYIRLLPTYCLGAKVFGVCLGSTLNIQFFLGIFFVALGAFATFLAVRDSEEA